jgi:DNA-binding transcriptional MerR regulator
MQAIDAKRDFESIGQVAMLLGVSVDDVETLAERLNVAPAMRINRLRYFDREQVERLRAARKRSGS